MLIFNVYTYTQVRIREKVDIKNNPANTTQKINTLPPNKWVALESGTYFCQIELAAKHNNIVFDTLKVKTDDTTLSFYTYDYTPRRWSDVHMCYNKCTQSNFTYHVFLADAYGTNVGFMIPNVEAGDTLEFNYKSFIDRATHFTGMTLGLAQKDPMSGTCYLYYEGAFQDLDYIGIKLTLADTVIKFSAVESDSICPTIPNYNDNLSRRNWLELELNVTYGSLTLKDVWVKVYKPELVDSGGHSHNGNRPMGKYRLPKPPPDTGYYLPVDSFIQKTDSLGKVRFRYYASEFGGIEKIKASLLSDTINFDEIDIKVKVDSLYLLPDGMNYTKVGGTCNHHGPGSQSGCTTPDNNHYGTRSVIDSIISIANAWANAFPNEPRLFINDISLPYGGGFDVNGRWEQDIVPGGAHYTHRDGKDVDIRTAFPEPPLRAGINIRDVNGNIIRDERGRAIGNELFNIIVRARGGKPSIHGILDTRSEHYHLDF